MSDAYLLYLEDIQKTYGDKLVLADIDLAVKQGEFCTAVVACVRNTFISFSI